LPYIEGASEVINAATMDDFPRQGSSSVIYNAEQEKCLYQWNDEYQSYEKLFTGGGEGGSDWNEITLINGGKA
jgi:hypothetical protein